jgi:hypothetical protein
MDTLWMLQGRYQHMPIIPDEVVARDFFGLERRVFLRKVDDGSIKLPLVRMEKSNKARKGVHVRHLAAFLDERAIEAEREFEQLHS